MTAATALDHVGLATADPRALGALYARLGFTLSPLSQQSGRRSPELPVELFGSANHCVMLREGFIELLGLVDPTLFDNGLKQFLARHEGVHILAFEMQDEVANLERLRGAGVPIPGVAWLQRPVGEADGPIARFARLPVPDAPEGRVQLVRHLTPELLWREPWLTHRNRAVALESAILVAEDPGESAARLGTLTGIAAVADGAGGWVLRLPRGAVRILPPAALPAVLPGVAVPSLPFTAGFVVRTDDGNAAVRALLGDVLQPVAEGLMVPPALAGGAALVFSPG
ncbi:VOC family protein [Roseomonas sp. 18066]|uniref:VOC family protein n=1 Tax=Roseomonas sp. 18066 TaxID=2681412 RepID=UPI00135C5F54|nr:VOC family protein [Roseomonas sp. 18066]